MEMKLINVLKRLTGLKARLKQYDRMKQLLINMCSNIQDIPPFARQPKKFKINMPKLSNLKKVTVCFKSQNMTLAKSESIFKQVLFTFSF